MDDDHFKFPVLIPRFLHACLSFGTSYYEDFVFVVEQSRKFEKDSNFDKLIQSC